MENNFHATLIGKVMTIFFGERDNFSSRSQALAGLFYDTDYVKDMHEDLGNVCDKLLPSAWKRVTEQYRAMRSIVIQL